MQNFKDLKVGMKVKFKNCKDWEDVNDLGITEEMKTYSEKVVTISEIDKEGDFGIKEDEQTEWKWWFSLEWIDHIVESEQTVKVEVAKNFRDLKPGDRVKLKKLEECKETRTLGPMGCISQRAKFAGEIVTIVRIDKDFDFKIKEDQLDWTYSSDWVEHIVEPEKPVQVENIQTCEPVQLHNSENLYKVQELKHLNTKYWLYTGENFQFSIVEIFGRSENAKYELNLENFQKGHYLSEFSTKEQCEKYALEMIARKVIRTLTENK